MTMPQFCTTPTQGMGVQVTIYTTSTGGVLHYGQEGEEGPAFGDEAESFSHAEFRIKRRDTVEIDDHHSDLASVLLCGGVGVRRVYAEGASRAQPLHVCAAVHDEVCPDWAGDRQIG